MHMQDSRIGRGKDFCSAPPYTGGFDDPVGRSSMQGSIHDELQHTIQRSFRNNSCH